MIGRDYPELGRVVQQSLGTAVGTISAGSDPDSPAFAYKGDKTICPNEDGLIALRQGSRLLLAVADGHLGHYSSHALLDGLSTIQQIPVRLGPLSLILASSDWIDETAGGTTLLVACVDEKTGSVFGLSFGDSSLVTIGPTGARVRNELNDVYLRGGGPIEVETARPFQFQLAAGETLLLYTDGVNECCYRDPFRSVKLKHLEQIYQEHPTSACALSRTLMDLALAGVEGNAGGQDNIVIVAMPFQSIEV